MSKENSITPDAILALDTGGEGTKFIYSLISGEAYSGFMEPEVIEIPQSSQEEFQNLKLSVAEPEDACWVGWNGQYHAVGYLAKTQFLANDRLAESKLEAASSKALAAIWVMAAKLKLKERFKLAVKLVLPPGEFAARETLQNKLLSQAKNFSTPSGKIFTEIVHFQCLPEGAGIYLNYLDANENALKRKTIALRYKEFLMPCLKACWLPRALIETQATHQEIQLAAADGMLWLERQIDYLRQLGQLPNYNRQPVVMFGKLPSQSATTETENAPDISDIETGFGTWS